MKLPFTAEQFLEVFKNYNEAIFPLQIIFYLGAAVILHIIFKKKEGGGRIVAAALSFFWLWIGIVYHIIYFSSINKAAYIFGSLFIAEGILIFIYGIILNRLRFGYVKNIYSYAAIILILYALVIYPLIGIISGRVYPYTITLGLPCPSTIFTFGIFLLAERKVPFAVLIIPLLWSILGFSAALNFSVYEDFGLIISGLLGFSLSIGFKRRVNREAKAA